MQARLHRISAAALAAGVMMAAGLVSSADAVPGNGNANGHGKGHCRAFHATGVGTDNNDLTTSATLYHGQNAVGSTEGAFELVATVDGVLYFTGTILLTTPKGTLDAAVEGTIDTVSGDFAAHSTEVVGAGAFKNATSKLRVWGTQDLAALTFTEVVHARICVPKKEH